MICFEPGAIAPHRRPGAAAGLLLWALVLSARAAETSSGVPASIQRRKLRGELRNATEQANAESTTGSPACQCPTYDMWPCDEETQTRNCTCNKSMLLQWDEEGGLATVLYGDPALCQSYSSSCRFACNQYKLFCNQGYCSCYSADGEATCSDDVRLQFMTAAQIALGAALVVAVMALAVLVWKMCYRPGGRGLFSGRLRRGALFGRSDEDPRDGADDGSANSIQNFVIQKMRDRPPRYEDAPPEMPPCYDEVFGGSSPVPATPGCPPCLPPYDLVARTGGGARRPARRERRRPRGASSGRHQAREADVNNDTPRQSIIIVTESQSSPSSVYTTSNTSPDGEQDGIDNPAFVREIYEHHM